MSFILDSGYIPLTIEQIMELMRLGVNDKFSTTYTTDTFLGTNFYKYLYTLGQQVQLNEIKASEIFLKMQEYFDVTNESIQRPNTTHPGILDYFASNGYPVVSTKPPADLDAGKAYVCVDVDEGAGDYATRKLAICNLVKDCIVAGVVSQGTESSTIVLSNNQAFDFKFNLPDRIPILLRLTITTSDNNLYTISSPEVSKQKLYDNIVANYKLGKNFEPQRYFSVVDAPWASNVLLEWSDNDGGDWHDEVFESEYDELFTFELADIELVED